MKAGIKSTEFWLSIISVIVSVWFTINSFIPPAVAMEVIKWVGVAYIIARAIVKATSTTKDDEILGKIEEIITNAKKK